MGKSTISMVIFNSYVKLPEGIEQPSPDHSISGPRVHPSLSLSDSEHDQLEHDSWQAAEERSTPIAKRIRWKNNGIHDN
jgi:hypothetical protein